MPIDVQLKSLLFSLFYGLLFSIMLRINYKYMYKGPLILKILINLFFVMDNVLIYFIFLKKLNEGIVHTYFLLMILLGFVIMELLFKKIPFDFSHKWWYNDNIGDYMAKKVSKQTRRRLFLITMLTFAVLFTFSLNLWKMFSQVIEKNRESAFLRTEIERLEDEESYLKVEVEKLNDPEYVARYARERYLYSKDGEFTIRIPEAQ